MSIVLASASPRRIELMERLGIDYIVEPSEYDEHIDIKDPKDFVLKISLEKALDVRRRRGKDDIIIAADTVVAFEGEIFGKPESPEDAVKTLERLSGRMNEVWTGLCVIRGDKVLSEAVLTKVYFDNIEYGDIIGYVETGEPLDKAGSYGIQGKASLFIKKIEGDYYNAVGFPLNTLYRLLKMLGVNLF